jgi:hypothetical protein
MADVTLDKVFKDALALSPEERRRLVELLTASAPPARPQQTIEQMAASQGKRPLDFAEIRQLGSFFPEDESVDDLVSTVRELRQDRSTRDLE